MISLGKWVLTDPWGSILSEYMSFIGKTAVLHCVKNSEYQPFIILYNIPWHSPSNTASLHLNSKNLSSWSLSDILDRKSCYVEFFLKSCHHGCEHNPVITQSPMNNSHLYLELPEHVNIWWHLDLFDNYWGLCVIRYPRDLTGVSHPSEQHYIF